MSVLQVSALALLTCDLSVRCCLLLAYGVVELPFCLQLLVLANSIVQTVFFTSSVCRFMLKAISAYHSRTGLSSGCIQIGEDLN